MNADLTGWPCWLAEAPSLYKSITTYAPDSTGVEDYRTLAKEIIKQEGGRK